MSSAPFPCDELVKEALAEGVDAIAITPAVELPSHIIEAYSKWLKSGGHASMTYLEKYPELRANPTELLPGAQSVISCAISYRHTRVQPEGVPSIAHYAHGDDYHDVVREILERVAEYIKERFGGETRVCVDTSPVMERYWATASGLGFRGRNGLVIVPGLGSYCFLGEIITTAPFEARHHTDITRCRECGECLKRCPGQAIMPDGTVMAGRCLSYLTIEHRGDFPENFSTCGRLYGCDECQKVCPHNRETAVDLHPRFNLRPAYATLTPDVIENMSQEDFSTIFKHSAIKRAKLAGLKRNSRHL